MKYAILFVAYIVTLAICDLVLHLSATWMFFSGWVIWYVAYPMMNNVEEKP